MKQALSAARRAGASEDLQHEILLNTMHELESLSLGVTPPDMAVKIHKTVRQKTSNLDPYKQAKDQATQEALALYPELKKQVSTASDPLEMAVRIAIALTKSLNI